MHVLVRRIYWFVVSWVQHIMFVFSARLSLSRLGRLFFLRQSEIEEPHHHSRGPDFQHAVRQQFKRPTRWETSHDCCPLIIVCDWKASVPYWTILASAVVGWFRRPASKELTTPVSFFEHILCRLLLHSLDEISVGLKNDRPGREPHGTR